MVVDLLSSASEIPPMAPSSSLLVVSKNDFSNFLSLFNLSVFSFLDYLYLKKKVTKFAIIMFGGF